ncbi:MAG: ABC transporter permease [bacterium]
MIRTVLRINWTELKRDRIAQMMTFLLPVAFFTIFAFVFGGQRDTTGRVKVAVVDEDHSEFSTRLVAALQKEESLRVRTTMKVPGAGKDAPEVPLTRDEAEKMVKNGDLPVALVLPAGLGKNFPNFGGSSDGPAVEMLSDPSDPIAPQIVNGLLQKVIMTATPDLMMKNGIDQFEKFAGTLTPEQRRNVEQWLPELKKEVERADAPTIAKEGVGAEFDSAHKNENRDEASSSPTSDSGDPSSSVMQGLVPVKTVDVIGEQTDNPIISFYAAGIGVMFLLFMTSGAGGTLLEEVENGTLERLLNSNIGMGGLLAGKWIYLALLGVLEISVMFIWGMVAFKLPLLTHLPGFIVMTLWTAAAAAGFGLVLATACRTRAQLGGISTLVILMMSALGGSMFPRFLMTDTMQKIGLVTFNAWALDGYVKVFWRDAALWELWPQLLVMTGLTVAFLAVARLLARRWEAA